MDHWGVLCLPKKHGREHSKTDLPNVKEMRIHGSFDDFDKEAIIILNNIIIETDLEIVISSDWKRWCSLEEMKKFYKSQGIIKTPMDYTPLIKGVNRALEIKEWLNNNKVNKWVAIDDMYLELDNFVWVSRTDEGIKQEGRKEEILKYLK
jgi:hypothetical protein